MSAEYYIATRERSALGPFAHSLIPEYGGASVIWPRAQELIEEGVDGLRIVQQRLDAIDRFSEAARAAFLERNGTVRKNLALNQAAVIAGVSLHQVENMLITARFNEGDFVREYHSAVGKSPLALDLWAENPEPVEIDHDANLQYLSIAQKDRTLSSFLYHQNLLTTPSGLQRLLTESNTLDTIRLYILPSYKNKGAIKLD